MLRPAKSSLTNPIYQDAEAARLHLEAVLWPSGPVCPYCCNTEAGTIALVEGVKRSHRPGFIKRIHDARGVKMDEVLETHFQRLKEITRIRNQLAHCGVKFEYDAAGIAGAATLSNSRIAHIPSKHHEIEMGPETLYGLVRELEAIGMALWVRLHPERFDR